MICRIRIGRANIASIFIGHIFIMAHILIGRDSIAIMILIVFAVVIVFRICVVVVGVVRMFIIVVIVGSLSC